MYTLLKKILLAMVTGLMLSFFAITISCGDDDPFSPETVTITQTNITVTTIYTNNNGDIVYSTPKYIYDDIVGIQFTDYDYPNGYYQITIGGLWTNHSDGAYGYNSGGSIVFTNRDENYVIRQYTSHSGLPGWGQSNNSYTKWTWQRVVWTNEEPLFNGIIFLCTEILTADWNGFSTITEATNASTAGATWSVQRQISY
jgi:hypothetical protein